MISARAATLAFGLEGRAEAAINGALAGGPVSNPTELTALIIKFASSDRPFVLISGDIIWFPSELSDSLRQQISEVVHTEVARVCLAASHTHGTPNPERSFQFPECSKALVEHISQSVLRVVDQAMQSQPSVVQLKFAQSDLVGPAINRRRRAFAFRPQVSYRMQNLPNIQGSFDPRVDVIVVDDMSASKPLAVIARYTCHPVADARCMRGADYPGFFRQTLRRKLGATVPVLFLQGFCGDVRPNLQVSPVGLRDWLIWLLVGPRFRRSRDGDAESLGEQIGISVIELLDQMAAPSVACAGVSDAHQHHIELQLDDDTKSKKQLDLTIWGWPNVRFVFASGEMLSGLLPRDATACLCVGYANGMVGYVPASCDLDYGGYEVDASRSSFGIAARLARKSCEEIARVIDRAARG